MICAAVILHLCCALGAVAPLSPQQESQMAGTVDGNDDLSDAAFEALAENVRSWTPGVGDSPIRLLPDYAAMLAAPHQFRGDLCRIHGRLEQQSRLDSPNEDVAEWFVRGTDGQPAVVYIIGAAGMQGRFVDGGKVEVDARFYKRVDAIARDGQVRSYPAFVGTFPRIGDQVAAAATSTRDGGIGRMWAIAAPVIVLGIVFGGLLVLARRTWRQERRTSVDRQGAEWSDGQRSETEEPEEGRLPVDAAEALAVLKRRAKGEDR